MSLHDPRHPAPILAFALTAVLVLASCAPGAPRSGGAQTDATSPVTTAHPAVAFPGMPAKQILLRTDLRKLWEDHITWTRLFIVSFAAGLPDADAAAGRLLRNQEDIGKAIAPYYGSAAGDKLTGLLQEHILVAVDVLKAAKAGDTKAFGAANDKWYGNMDEISAFLSSANPTNWPLETVRPFMRTHLDLTLEEASARLKGDWAADIAAYDKIHEHALQMSDTLSDGIVRQFPDRFR